MSKVIKRGQKRSNKLKKDTLDERMEFFEGDKDLSENVDLYVYGEKRLIKVKKIKKDPAMRIIGLGGSEKGNLSYEHDRYLIKYSSRKK